MFNVYYKLCAQRKFLAVPGRTWSGRALSSQMQNICYSRPEHLFNLNISHFKAKTFILWIFSCTLIHWLKIDLFLCFQYCTKAPMNINNKYLSTIWIIKDIFLQNWNHPLFSTDCTILHFHKQCEKIMTFAYPSQHIIFYFIISHFMVFNYICQLV